MRELNTVQLHFLLLRCNFEKLIITNLSLSRMSTDWVQNNFWFERQPNWQHMMEFLSERLANMSPHWAAVSCISHSQLMYPHSLASSFLTLLPWWPNLRCSRVTTSIFERPYRSPHVALVRLLHLSAPIHLLFIPNLLALLPTFQLYARTYNLFGLHSCTFWPPPNEYTIHTWLGGWNLWQPPVLHTFLPKKPPNSVWHRSLN